MGSGLSEAVEGYLQLAGWWIEAWGTHATAVANKLDSGTYSADDAVGDLAGCASLAVESLVLLVNEPFDAAAVLTGKQDRPHIVTSKQPFTTAGGAASARWLQVDGPLGALIGTDSLPVAAVKLDPNPLPPGVTAFDLVVNATGHAGVTYSGSVGVFNADGTIRLETIQVWISVP